jgi:hypothetical protein
MDNNQFYPIKVRKLTIIQELMLSSFSERYISLGEKTYGYKACGQSASRQT